MDKVRIVLEVRGGVLVACTATNDSLKVYLVDYDWEGEKPKAVHVEYEVDRKEVKRLINL